jgi:hypothetical protein
MVLNLRIAKPERFNEERRLRSSGSMRRSEEMLSRG